MRKRSRKAIGAVLVEAEPGQHVDGGVAVVAVGPADGPETEHRRDDRVTGEFPAADQQRLQDREFGEEVGMLEGPCDAKVRRSGPGAARRSPVAHPLPPALQEHSAADGAVPRSYGRL